MLGLRKNPPFFPTHFLYFPSVKNVHYQSSHFRLRIRPNRPNLAIWYRPNYPKVVIKSACVFFCLFYLQPEPHGTTYRRSFLLSSCYATPLACGSLIGHGAPGMEIYHILSIQSVRLLPPDIIRLNIPADRLSSVRTVPISINISLSTTHCHDAASVRTLRPSQPSKPSKPSNPFLPTAALPGALPETSRHHDTHIFFYFLILSTISSLFLSLPQDTVRESSGSLNAVMNPPVHLSKIPLHNQSLPVPRSLISLTFRTDGTVWTELSAKPPVCL